MNIEPHANIARVFEVPATFRTRARNLSAKFLCFLFGHAVDNHVFEKVLAVTKHCACGAEFLQKGERETRIRHNVSCFIYGHSYTRVGARDGYIEFVCRQCGHPLLFAETHDFYAEQRTFLKKVRYLCNLFGHEVQKVVERDGFAEYACHCGHTFLKRNTNYNFIKHPPICLFAGHYVRYVAHRCGYAEFLCRNCGHTFCFADKQKALDRNQSRAFR